MHHGHTRKDKIINKCIWKNVVGALIEETRNSTWAVFSCVGKTSRASSEKAYPLEDSYIKRGRGRPWKILGDTC